MNIIFGILFWIVLIAGVAVTPIGFPGTFIIAVSVLIFDILMDFEGFRVLRSQTNNPSDFLITAQFDLVNNLGPDFGLPPRNSEGLFEFADTDVPNGFELFYSVISFDKGDSAIPSLESGIRKY